MDFTREPIVETVITPREGFNLVVRSSKSAGQEEFFVDAVEVVSFGNALFFRSMEKPKNFIVPVNDYEVLEVREARMVLKNVGVDRTVKIAGGREAPRAPTPPQEKPVQQQPQPVAAAPAPQAADDGKKRDRRGRQRRRRGSGRDEAATPTEGSQPEVRAPVMPSALMAPPPALISETLQRYKDNAEFRGAFYEKGEGSAVTEKKEEPARPREESGYPSLDAFDEELDHPVLPETKSSKTSEEKLWDFSQDLPSNDHSR